MSIVRLVEYAEAPPEVRAVYDEIMQARGTDWINNFWKALANDPALLRRTWENVRQVMAPGALDPLVKELIYVAVSATNGCEYCTHSHTAAAIGATFLQIGLLALLRRKIEPMLWVSLGIIVVFGGATLLLRDETFIKWKPTVLYWLFGAALAISELLLHKNLIRAMMSAQVQLPEPVWRKLNWSWAGFFAFMGAANLLVAFNFSTEQWVNFKLFGATGLMLVFVLAQAVFLARHVEEDALKKDKP